MREGELRDVMRGLVAGDGRALVEEARAEAREEVKRLLVEFFTTELIDQVISAASPGGPNVQQLRPRERQEPRVDEVGSAVYVYGIVAADRVPEISGQGIDGSAVRTVGADHLAALVSDVQLTSFGEEPLRRNLNDLEWLTDKVTLHQEVLSRAVSAATVVPMRFCTIYRDDDSVRAILARHADTIAEALESLRGRDEYGVRISFELPAAEETADTGRAYLEAKQASRTLLEQRRESAASAARLAHARLQEHAQASVLGRLQRDPALATEGRELALNASYLVAHARLDTFAAEVENLVAEHPELTIDRTGPWPPYNFVTLELEDDRGRDTG